MPGKPSRGKPRGRGYKSSGHTYGDCSRKRALIKQRVHRLEEALVIQDDVLVTLIRDYQALEGLVNDLYTLVAGENQSLRSAKLNFGGDKLDSIFSDTNYVREEKE